jgi:hypothetical protein
MTKSTHIHHLLLNTMKSNSLEKKSLRSLLSLLLSTACFIPLGANRVSATIVETVTDDISSAWLREASTSKGGAACNILENVTALMGNTSHPIRAGKQAFRHWVNRCGERSELAMRRTVIGNTYWYGWSMYIPANWQNPSDAYDILAQWATYPTPRNGRFACGANGSYIVRNSEDITFRLQFKGEKTDSECIRYPLAKLADVRGKWVDFVMHVKWTGNTDGFTKLWVKVGDGAYTQKVDYKGRTFWNDEGDGPYFKMGLYKGDPNFSGAAPRYLYTDEYRLGDANAKFEDVAPGGVSNTQPKPEPRPETEPRLKISENFSTSASNFNVELGGAWTVSNGKYLLSDTNQDPSTPYSNRNLSVHKTSIAGNFTLSVDASVIPTSSRWDDFSIIFNYQDLNNYYFASFNESIDNFTHGIFKVENGVATKIANFSSVINAGTTYNIKVEKTGNTIKVYRNNSLQAAVTDATFSGGRVGFGSRNNSAIFDNLIVE